MGLDVATRLASAGMQGVAILDISTAELRSAEERLAQYSGVVGIECNVADYDTCERAAAAVAESFPGLPVTFLFNNAGIQGRGGIGVLDSHHAQWPKVFSVNVFGAVNILKTFVPGMLAAGPLPSGKKTYVVTTSSVAGLLNFAPAAYGVSKMAATALCEQFAIELEEMGSAAAHISPHSLHPTVVATNFLSKRSEDGAKELEGAQLTKFLQAVGSKGMSTAPQIVDELFARLDRGEHYIIIDNPMDVPTVKSAAARAADVISRGRPQRPAQLYGTMMMMRDQAGMKHRQDEKAGVGSVQSKL